MRRTLEERFWAKVDKSDGCWLWRGATIWSGYGKLWVSGAYVRAHRLSYELAHGPIPDGLCVCHRCDVRLCVNPSHLFLGTIVENLADMRAKGRQAPVPRLRGEAHGRSKLTSDQVSRARALAGTMRQADIAALLGVSQTHISRIVAGDSWGHTVTNVPDRLRKRRARLTDADVAAIRALAGKLTHAEIARRFMASRSHIGNLIAGTFRSQSRVAA